MKKEFSAGLIIYYQTRRSKKYLLLQYSKGHWDFPKGHIEAHETKEQAALRETAEETGITVQDLLLHTGCEYHLTYFFRDVHTHELIHKTVYFFAAQSHTTAVHLSEEHLDFVWLSYGTALKKLTYQNARDALQYVHEWLIKNVNTT